MRINAERRVSSIVISCCLSQKRCYSLFKLRAYSILSDKPLPLFMKVDGGVSGKQFWDEGDRIIETLSEVRDRLTQIAKGYLEESTRPETVARDDAEKTLARLVIRIKAEPVATTSRRNSCDCATSS